MEYLKKDSIRQFWDKRAGLGKWAGTQDVIAKEIEMTAISKYIKNGMTILEAGCGNGISAIHFARHFDVSLLATDFSEQMVNEARKLALEHDLKGRLDFGVMDILDLAKADRTFDMIYTERVIINLMEWSIQEKAITGLFSLLKPGGLFVMCENSQDGLEGINELRKNVGLEPYTSPWHNRYLRDEEIARVVSADVRLEKVDYYSSTYYFLSRVVNAALARNEDAEPEYDSFVNQLALNLPPFGNFGQGRIWVWRKAHE